MAPFLPIRAVSRSQNVRIGGVKVKTNETTYVDLSETAHSKPYAYSPLKELKSHLAVGAVIVVGAITSSSADWVVVSGFTTAETKAENEKEYLAKISSGTLRQRSTGTTVEQAGSQESAKVKGAKTGKEKIDRLEVKNTTGALKVTAGTEAAEGKAEAPVETAGYTTVATVTTINEKIEATPADFKVTDTRPRP